MDEKNLNDEIIQEKVKEKVEEKSQKVKQPQCKECDVLLYNVKKQTLVASFDGLGYEFHDVTENPGKTVRVKQSGKMGTPSFKLALV